MDIKEDVVLGTCCICGKEMLLVYENYCKYCNFEKKLMEEKDDCSSENNG